MRAGDGEWNLRQKVFMERDPIKLFKKLHKQYVGHGLPEPDSMVLATATPDGWPSARVVLLKGVDSGGFIFYTNTESRKVHDLNQNPHTALCFHWEAIHYQVRVEGKVKAVAPEEADTYFASRPRGSQVAAWASKQSTALDSRKLLDQQIEKFTKIFADTDVPRPPFWSGYRVVPARMEFWLRQPDRLHERTLYSRGKEDWEISLLYP